MADPGVVNFRQERYEKYRSKEGGRSGPGENGLAVVLEGEEKKLADSLFEKEAFNIIASDKIALDRSIVDKRDGRWVDLVTQVTIDRIIQSLDRLLFWLSRKSKIASDQETGLFGLG